MNKIKRVGNQLMKDFEGDFSTDYQKNLEMLSDKIICAKVYRNKICGYITRSIKLKLASEADAEVTTDAVTISDSDKTNVDSESTNIKKSDSSN